MSALEGACIATRDINFIVVGYLAFATGILSWMTFVRRAGLGVQGVWKGLAVYQILRMVLLTQRVQSRTFKHLDSSGSGSPRRADSNDGATVDMKL